MLSSFPCEDTVFTFFSHKRQTACCEDGVHVELDQKYGGGKAEAPAMFSSHSLPGGLTPTHILIHVTLTTLT